VPPRLRKLTFLSLPQPVPQQTTSRSRTMAFITAVPSKWSVPAGGGNKPFARLLPCAAFIHTLAEASAVVDLWIRECFFRVSGWQNYASFVQAELNGDTDPTHSATVRIPTTPSIQRPWGLRVFVLPSHTAVWSPRPCATTLCCCCCASALLCLFFSFPPFCAG